jgi:hypothetical protein
MQDRERQLADLASPLCPGAIKAMVHRGRPSSIKAREGLGAAGVWVWERLGEGGRGGRAQTAGPEHHRGLQRPAKPWSHSA